MTRDPAANPPKCPSTASIRTLAAEPEFGHQLHRCAKRMEQVMDAKDKVLRDKSQQKATDTSEQRESDKAEGQRCEK